MIMLILVLLSGYQAFKKHQPYWAFTLGPWIGIFVVCFLAGAWLVKENNKRTDAWSWGVTPLITVDLQTGVAPFLKEEEVERNKFEKARIFVLETI